jgi:hypothetical protein
MTSDSLKVSMRMITSTIDKIVTAFRPEDCFDVHELFVGAYSAKYGVSRTRIMRLIDEGYLSATTIEGIWIVEDKPPPAARAGFEPN